MGHYTILLAASAMSFGQIPSHAEMARTSDMVIVATAVDVTGRWDTSPQGDEIIVATVALEVEEVLKGDPMGFLTIESIGGTVGNDSMDIAHIPVLHQGDRAVLFLKRSPKAWLMRPQEHGILKLDKQNRVIGTGLDLATIRKAVPR